MGCTHSSKSTKHHKNYTVHFYQKDKFVGETDRRPEFVGMCNKREYFDEFDLIYEEMIAERPTTGCLNLRKIKESFCMKKKTVHLAFKYPSVRLESKNSKNQLETWRKWFSCSIPKEDCSDLLNPHESVTRRVFLKSQCV